MFVKMNKIAKLRVFLRWFIVLLAPLSLINTAFAQKISIRPGLIPNQVGKDFYVLPERLNYANGTVLKQEDVNTYFQSPHIIGSWPGEVTRVLYKSTNLANKDVAVSGIMMRSTQPWLGKGVKPIMVLAPGTQGLSINCAPSKNLTNLFNVHLVNGAAPIVAVNYEFFMALTLLKKGIDVFMTDYYHDPINGIQTYTNRVDQGKSVLDAARAAINLVDKRTDLYHPVGFWGFSQGGGAVGDALELKSTYAPELNLKGGFAGSPPADLLAVMRWLDKKVIPGGAFIAMALRSFKAAYPEIVSGVVDKYLNDLGKHMLNSAGYRCVADSILTTTLERTKFWTKSGKSIPELIFQPPLAAVKRILELQKLGTVKAAAPVYLNSSPGDDILPYNQVKQLARDYCRLGTPVVFRNYQIPELPINYAFAHLGDYVIEAGYSAKLLPNSQERALQFMLDRFNDVPFSGCKIDM